MREKLLGPGGAPVPEAEREQPAAAPRPIVTPRGRVRPVVDLKRLSEAELDRLAAISMKRRSNQ